MRRELHSKFRAQFCLQGDLSMPVETILMIVALIAAILVLAIGLRPLPLYSDPEALPKRKDSNAEKDE